ncbi:MAG: hypothetical protein GQ565_09195 [Candidatus Aegiribacteria sp.]|nr:hypothetical protein [Candidatus Aegiribacteria sp.]
MKYLMICASVILALTVAACGDGQPEAAVDESAEDTGITLELLFVDSIGVELGDSNYVLGSIEASSHTLDGNILILDRPACCVREYTTGGEFVRQYGRRGTGPGEVVNPLSMTRLTDGHVVMLDMQTGGLHTFSPDGEWLGVTVEIINEPILWITPAESNTYLGTHNTFDVEDGQLFVTAVVGKFESDSKEPIITYWENTFPFDFIDFTVLINESYFANVFTSDREGNVFLARRDTKEYQITGFDVNGDVFVEFKLDTPMAEKSEQEIIEEAEFWNTRARNMGANGELNYMPDPFRWKIHSMGIDDQHRLWVRRGTEETPTFDVFDYEGNHLFTAELPGITGHSGLLWEVHVDEEGILAWSLDPPDGYQILYIVELADQ